MIDEIKELIGIDKVETFDDLLKIRDFCFRLIPWTPVAYKIHSDDNLFDLCAKFKKNQIGGWCGLNANFFSHLMWQVYGFDKHGCEPFNYGLKDFSHVTLIVRLAEDKEYLIDPYFCRHYVFENGDPLEFKNLIFLIFNRDLGKIHEIYGTDFKYVYQEAQKDFLKWGPEKLQDSVMDSWIQLKNYETFMKDLFNSTDSKLLMLSRIF